MSDNTGDTMSEGAFDLEVRANLEQVYPDVLTHAVRRALDSLAHLDRARRDLMEARIQRRAERARLSKRIDFLPADAVIPRTEVSVRAAREGDFDGSEIPGDLKRQWIQGTGPAARP